jgi:hypothetical protein
MSRVCLKKLVFFLRQQSPEHNYIYHDVTFSFPRYLRELNFHAVILDVTLLAQRWGRQSKFNKIKKDYQFVSDLDAMKLAFPQDDYDCHLLLDDWMVEWNVDVVFSVISSNWEILYPRFSMHGEIKLGYTGYVDDSLIDYASKDFHARSIDIGYRAKKLLPYFGYIGETKWQIGLEVKKEAQRLNLKEDIQIGDEHQLLGNHWYEFINDCKFTLGTNSGSSLLDPDGSVRKKVMRYIKKHPEAIFPDVESACFAGLDRKESFTAISPRILEAALLNSAQILVEGEYSKVLKPWDHFIPINSVASDFEQAYHAMLDESEVERRIKRCREAILDCPFLRFSSKAKTIFELIYANLDSNLGQSLSISATNTLANYESESHRTAAFVFGAKRLRGRMSSIPIIGLLAKLLLSSFILRLAIRIFRLLGLRFSAP